MDNIFPGLWLGPLPFKENIPVLKQNNINSILSIDILPLSSNDFKNFNLKFLYLRDEPSQDLLGILEEALSFIQLNVKNAVGVSRSASVAMAYIMKQNKLSYDEAYEYLSRKRSVYPNYGFINQLKLFHTMGWRVDPNSPVFIQYTDYHNELSHTCENNKHSLATFRCRKCSVHQKPSKTPEIFSSQTNPDISKVLIDGVSINETFYTCDKEELFTDALSWTRDVSNEVEGKLYCPGCKAKVGSFNWCGEPCTCGTWVVPAFHFNRNHLDRIALRSENLQISRPQQTRTSVVNVEWLLTKWFIDGNYRLKGTNSILYNIATPRLEYQICPNFK